KANASIIYKTDRPLVGCAPIVALEFTASRKVFAEVPDGYRGKFPEPCKPLFAFFIWRLPAMKCFDICSCFVRSGVHRNERFVDLLTILSTVIAQQRQALKESRRQSRPYLNIDWHLIPSKFQPEINQSQKTAP